MHLFISLYHRGAPTGVNPDKARLVWMLLLIACHHRGPSPTQCALAETVEVRTEDGAGVVLHHHAGKGPPVLVVHGLSSNHWCWDLTPDRSLADALVAAGYDAWLLDLRGHGDARDVHPRSKPGWTVDDYGRYDLKAAINYVRNHTGYAKIGYIGHSMGGMVAAIYQSIYGDDALAALVVVGSPVDFADPDRLLILSERGFALGSLLPDIRTPAVARAVMPLGEHQPLHADEILFNPDNLTGPARDLMFRYAASPVYRNEVRQFNRILAEGRFVSADGAEDYAADLARLRAPLLVISGRVDRIAPSDRVLAYYRAAGSPEKRYVLAAKANGFSADYGHLDLPLGDAAAAEIYPLIVGWMAGRWPTEETP